MTNNRIEISPILVGYSEILAIVGDIVRVKVPEEENTVQHQLLRIAQEAISNAIRHAKPTVVTVTLRWDPPNLMVSPVDALEEQSFLIAPTVLHVWFIRFLARKNQCAVKSHESPVGEI